MIKHLFLAGSLTALLTACGDTPPETLDCTEIGCSDGLSIDFSPEFSTPGAYSISITLDDRTVTCTMSLPLQESNSCDADDLFFGRSGSALPDADHRLTGFSTSDTPEEVRVQITRDETLIAEETFSPEYEVLQPNGEGCDPTCNLAEETLSVTAP